MNDTLNAAQLLSALGTNNHKHRRAELPQKLTSDGYKQASENISLTESSMFCFVWEVINMLKEK